MNFLTRILAIDAPENTRLESWAPSFRGLSLGWLAVILLIVSISIAAAVLFNLLEKGTVGWFRRIILIGLRSSLFMLLLFLILRPVLLAEFVGERPRGVALLIDHSQSMQQRDRRLTAQDKERITIAFGKDGQKNPRLTNVLAPEASRYPSRTELVHGVLVNPELKLLPGLQKLGPLRPHVFGYDTQELHQGDSAKVDLEEKIFAGLKDTASTRTALADSIIKILQSKNADPPSAIVVVTDGQDNASKFTLQEAAIECARHGIPLHIYGVGSSEGGQLQLKELGAPDTLFVDDNVSIPLRWRAQGFKKGEVEITLKLGDKTVATKKFNIQTGEDLRDVLSFMVPKDEQKRESLDLTATIEYRSGNEKFTDTLKRNVRVSDTRLKILYVEHGPRWEFKFLQPALMRDRRIHASPEKGERAFILVNADPKVSKDPPYLPEFPKSRDKFFEEKYDLIIIGDVASTFFTKEQQEWIKEHVQQGGGLIVMAGRQHMPSTYENTPIGEVLPIEFKKEKFGIDSEVRTQEYPPTLTEAGLRADWLALADTPEENLDVWQKKLLGFHWHYPIVKLKPAATALIVNPRVKIGEPATPTPVMATHYYGKGQVLWLGTDETWRWRWNYQDKYFVRFWGQVIYQFGLPHMLGSGAQRSHMALDRSQAVVGTESTIYVRLLDKDFNPRKDATVDAELDYVDAKPGDERKSSLKLHAIKGRPGEYAALVPHNRPGRFELRVKNPEENTFSFRVDLPPKHELEEAGLAEKALRDAAELSKGRFYREEDLHELPTRIESKTTEFRRRQEIVLWNPLAILLFLGLITTEWLIRKFSDLS